MQLLLIFFSFKFLSNEKLELLLLFLFFSSNESTLSGMFKIDIVF